jgi:ATP synthase protein I
MTTGERPDPPRTNDDLDRRRAALDKAIGHRRQNEVGSEPKSPRTSIAYALRLSTDFVAGVLVGAALGWGIDKLAGTSPWGLIVFLLLGFAAGVLNVMRSAGLVAEPFREKDGSLRERNDGGAGPNGD